MPKTVTWIVVADGARAHVVRQSHSGGPLEPVPGEDFVNPHQAAMRERGGEAQTREPTGFTHRRGLDSVDWHRYEKKKFAHAIAEHLEAAAQTDLFDKLVLVAPPETLGEMRMKLGKHAKTKLAAEIGKDLTAVPLQDLADHLGDAVRVAEQRAT